MRVEFHDEHEFEKWLRSLASPYRRRIGIGFEAADVLRHGAGEQFDMLRQIANGASQ